MDRPICVPVVFVNVPARIILNLTGPRYLPEISLCWRGKRDWHDPFYEPLRDLMQRTYVDEFNYVNGHYCLLENDIIENGVRNPVMLTTGGVRRRDKAEVPPRWGGWLISEYLGGSRIYIAQKHNLMIPAIVNDYAGLFLFAKKLNSARDVADCFESRPGIVTFSCAEGAYVNDMPFTHMPDDYSLTKQVPIRAAIVCKVAEAVKNWLAEYDREK